MDARGINGLINMECSKWRDNKNAWVSALKPTLRERLMPKRTAPSRTELESVGGSRHVRSQGHYWRHSSTEGVGYSGVPVGERRGLQARHDDREPAQANGVLHGAGELDDPS